MRNDMINPDDAGPEMPRFLGWAGSFHSQLPPFALTVALMGLCFMDFWGTGYAAHSGIFRGGALGSVMQDNRQNWYLWAVTPSLLATVTLMLFDVQWRLVALIPLFGLVWSVDMQAAQRGLFRMVHGIAHPTDDWRYHQPVGDVFA